MIDFSGKNYVRLHIYDPNTDTTDIQPIKIQSFGPDHKFDELVGSIIAK